VAQKCPLELLNAIYLGGIRGAVVVPFFFISLPFPPKAQAYSKVKVEL
jgi:hypothetical protein